MNLSMLKPGEAGKITAIVAIGPLKRRLMDMGVLMGEKVKVEKIDAMTTGPFKRWAEAILGFIHAPA